MGVYLGQPVPGGYKNRDLALQVWGSLESESVNVVMSPLRHGSENDCAGEDQQQTHPLFTEDCNRNCSVGK
jgi:hypothetical protein